MYRRTQMKINFIIPFKRLSGGIRVAFIYANYLQSKGHDVCCYLPAISYKGKNQNLFFRLKASLSNTFKRENWYSVNFPIKVVPFISDTFVRNADITIATAWQTAYDVIELSPSKGRRIYFVQDYEIFNGAEEEVINTYKLHFRVITITSELKRIIQKYNNDVYVIYNGIFEEEKIVGNKRSNRPFTISLMYHESDHKNSLEGIAAIKTIFDKYTDINVQVFGRRIPQLTIIPNASFFELPSRRQIIDIYRNSDVYLFTSKQEAWGLPIIEAMANKCVVIGREIGALKEVYNGKNALIASSAEQMAKKIESLYQDRKALSKMQEEAYNSVKTMTWENSCAQFEQLILKG